jgi:zinc protease
MELYPSDHPYHWPIIGWMNDLDAATLADVNGFFNTYYSPPNASLCVAGDVNCDHVLQLAQNYFAPIAAAPAPPPVRASAPGLRQMRVLTLEDDVQLPRLYFAWHSPAIFANGDAELDALGLILSQGKSARLYRSLVYEQGIAQDVEAFQASALLGSTFNIVVTARPQTDLNILAARVREELLRVNTQLETQELQRAINRFETSFVDSLQTVGGFSGRADRLNHYAYYLDDPGAINSDLARYHQLDMDAVTRALRLYVLDAPAVCLSVVPRGQAERALREAW